MKTYQIRINHRIADELETYITTVDASSMAQAKAGAKILAAQLEGRLIDVIDTDKL